MLTYKYDALPYGPFSNNLITNCISMDMGESSSSFTSQCLVSEVFIAIANRHLLHYLTENHLLQLSLNVT
jgi:hypothetical protein